MEVSPAQVLAFRLAAQGVAPRGGRDPLAPLTSWALQDSPPGTAALALATRAEALDPGALDAALHDDRDAVALYNPRTATAIVPAAEVAAYAAALRPHDADGWRALMARALPDDGELADPAAALAVALPAFAAALDGAELSRDDLHAELRERLPKPLLPWCDGCQSHHARRGLLVAAGLHGLLCIAGKAGRQPLFARTDQWLGDAAGWPGLGAAGAGGAGAGASNADAPAELVRRYLRGCGPSTPALFAQWAGIVPAQARTAWARVEAELAEVSVASGGGSGSGSSTGGSGTGGSSTGGSSTGGSSTGGSSTGGSGAGGSASARRAWLLAEDVPRLEAAEPRSGVVLLAPGDPLLLARDRELLLPDPAQRRRAFAALNAPGLALLDGAAVALWRGRKRGRTLDVALEPLTERPPSRRALRAIEREAVRLAPHRGCTSARAS